MFTHLVVIKYLEAKDTCGSRKYLLRLILLTNSTTYECLHSANNSRAKLIRHHTQELSHNDLDEIRIILEQLQNIKAPEDDGSTTNRTYEDFKFRHSHRRYTGSMKHKCDGTFLQKG